MTRIFKLKGFARFQRKERIDDAVLGGGLVKQRVARVGKGESGGYRTVIAFRRGDLAVFLYGFAKSERSNIDGVNWTRSAFLRVGIWG